MNYIVSNLIAIFAATVAGLAVGVVYHHFAPPLKASRIDARRQSLGLLVVALIAEFWLAAILAGALILAPTTRAGAWTMAIGSAVVIWIGFVVPVLIVSYVFHRMRVTVLLLEGGHWLAVMVMQAMILHLVGLVRP